MYLWINYLITGMHQGEGQVGQLPHQILADQKVPPGSGGAPHYYLPDRIFDHWCIPVLVPIFLPLPQAAPTFTMQVSE